MTKKEADKFIDKAIGYAFECHESTNHRYGKNGEHPYSFHLIKANNAGAKFSLLITPNDFRTKAIVRASVYCHDVIEDTRQTFNDVKKVLGEEVAEIVYALTNEKGRNRKERANKKYYDGIKATPYAVFVKLCDRIANVEYSKESGSSMLDKYRQEYPEFMEALYEKGTPYQEMWDYLSELLEESLVENLD
jgi:(p)ppGpp synthase/HD superfamily hydrolase